MGIVFITEPSSMTVGTDLMIEVVCCLQVRHAVVHPGAGVGGLFNNSFSHFIWSAAMQFDA